MMTKDPWVALGSSRRPRARYASCARLGVATQCGRCAQHAQRVLKETLNAAPEEENGKAA